MQTPCHSVVNGFSQLEKKKPIDETGFNLIHHKNIPYFGPLSHNAFKPLITHPLRCRLVMLGALNKSPLYEVERGFRGEYMSCRCVFVPLITHPHPPRFTRGRLSREGSLKAVTPLYLIAITAAGSHSPPS